MVVGDRWSLRGKLAAQRGILQVVGSGLQVILEVEQRAILAVDGDEACSTGGEHFLGVAGGMRAIFVAERTQERLDQ